MTNLHGGIALALLISLLVPACATSGVSQPELPAHVPQVQRAHTNRQSATAVATPPFTTRALAAISEPLQMGKLGNRALSEISGLAHSLRLPGTFFAINDSGNPATLYAISETGTHTAQWPVDASNRDWEDMSSVWHNGDAYLVLGDTGDNLGIHRESSLYIVPEPLIEASPANPSDMPLTPISTIRYVYEDGPRNVEAFAIADNEIYLISKEPVTAKGPSASQVYLLPFTLDSGDRLLTAKRVATMPLQDSSLESRLAASLAGIDLNHPTALDFDIANNSAYILSYRHVTKVTRNAGQTWAQAFAGGASRIFTHNLKQAEALSVFPGAGVWFTSENSNSPLWAIPLANTPGDND